MAGAVQSWMSHDELVRCIERYSNLVRAIDDLIWWWMSLEDVERANTSNITTLIKTGESIIATERLAWMTAVRRDNEASKDGDEGGGARTAPKSVGPEAGMGRGGSALGAARQEAWATSRSAAPAH